MAARISVLVTGATGKQGGAVARALLEKGHLVIAMTRNPDAEAARELERQGARLAAATFEDPSALRKAFAGADAVFLMGTPFESGTEAEARNGMTAIDAAKAEKVRHIVYTSVDSADRKTGIPHFESKYRVEKYVRSADIPFTIVGPAFFYENFLSPFSAPSLKEGKLSLGLSPSRTLKMISVETIGAFTAHVLENRGDFVGKRINIASDELTGPEAAAALSMAGGKQVTYEQVPAGELRARNPDMAAMYEWMGKVGYISDIANLRRAYPTIGWLRFEDWARGQDWSAIL